MQHFFRICFVIFFSSFSFAQNVELLSNVNQYPSIGYNDIWGYVDSQGREYALLGTQHGTSVIEITNPQQPVERAFVPGPSSLWRDIKTHSHYMYMVSEGGSGLQIVDLSGLPNSVNFITNHTTYFTTAHNLYIADGYAYVVGTNNFSGGMHILDLSNPVNPTRPAVYTASGYIHDVYVWNDTAYASAGSSRTYDMVNLTNKANPQMINKSAALPNIYAHSGWLTEDKRYFIACEEFNQRDITVWDLTDRSSWNLVVSQWQMSNNSYVHNVFVRGNYAHIAYYTSGYVVLDISDPANPQFAGQYDTYPQNNSQNYAGAWGAYPFFPSKAVVVSDMQTGLYVLNFLLDPLPVELASFTANVVPSGIQLNWETATETNNLGFEIERKSSGSESNFFTIGFVNGAGTTTSPQQYSYSDNIANAGIYTYRLKQVDLDGSFSYSNEIRVEFTTPDEFILKQNYPNPFNPSTTIEFVLGMDSFVNLDIFNMLGEKVTTLVNETMQQGFHSVNFKADNLPSGIYIAKLEAGGFTKNVKMSLMK
jgi:choice-of-anchor B domain-containing protein